MRCVCLLFPLLIPVALSAEPRARWTSEDLFQSVSASLALGYGDSVIAAQLQRVDLTERLADEPIELLRRQGAGALTLQTIRALAKRSASLNTPGNPTVVLSPQPAPAELGELLRKMRAYASDYVRTLPDFSCRQSTRYLTNEGARRLKAVQDMALAHAASNSPSRFGQDLRVTKTIVEEMEYYRGVERYRTKSIDNKPASKPVTRDTAPVISRGELGTMVRVTFAASSQIHFTWDHDESLRGRRVVALAYLVEREHSGLEACCRAGASQRFFPGYRGLVYVDPATAAIVRITLRLLDLSIAHGDPFDEGRVVLDYAPFDIGGKAHWLLAKAVMTARIGDTEERSDMEFTGYRKYNAESVITFTPEGGEPASSGSASPAAHPGK